MTRKSIIILVLAALVASGLWAGGKQEQSLPFEQRYQSMSWEQIVDEAGGQKLYWYMWGGSDLINKFVNGYLAERLRNEYDITLEMVPVTDAATFINKVLGEKQARRDSGGSVDVMWINGENFRTMREADLLFGPYADKLPHMQYIDSTDSSISNDFGFPVEGYESPYGSAQVVMVYDSARVPEPPRKIEDLLDWIRANPGKFTYPAIPDFTGSVFVRHLFYHV
ncbi:MAG: ABC transporter substrate-binding protein, partial [Spirochaetales bacterium]|nr:ABC transporter substrate-binding protein [Spirochaetales bacterium]